MKVAVIGATGKAGQAIVKEALERGHEVTAIVRSAAKVQQPGVQVVEKSIFDLKADDVKPFDVVVNAFAAPLGGGEGQHIEAGLSLIQAFKGAPDTRLIVVGGAGSLYVDEAQTLRLVDTPEFPDMFKATALSQAQNLQDLKQSSGIRWTFVSPAAFFDAEGGRTGSYQKGKDQLIVNGKGESYISYADYAIAIVDEIEQANHVGERFTVVGETK
ncbi:NAD(P)-dependent oxidoreductase [Paenibacillus protaetiae]|uniref:NAD(P)-dependent oxidoreductase n=1 Tax=Paenibacillus protaetiae TaxID=2509456 RepID=A0A4P6EYE5_9BACL|nr:NAD(P)-dependent oxidoreductase [Paenibacillus protaetiae]QAY68430.1 NAD(P)-dependent oxidoreductase [Paenibacillus protaetiae]